MMAPRSSGQTRSRGHGAIVPKNTSIATPMQISGTTIGSVIIPSNAPLPGKRNRHNAIAAIVPSTTLNSVEIAAIVSELANAPIRASSPAICVYQPVVNPSQRIVRFESLKLKSTRLASGR